MKKENFSVKEFNAIVKGANNEVKGVFNNPFVVINLLNKAVKGDFEKVANVEGITRENLQKVASVLKSIHKGRYPFDASLLTKDNKGRFVTIATSKTMPIWDYQLIDVIPNKGYKYYKPISLTINAIFNAFAKVAKVEVSDNVKAAKDNEKALKKSDRIKAQKIKVLNNAYLKGVLTEVEYNEKLNALKAA